MSIVNHYSDSWMLRIERNPKDLNLRSNHFYRLKNWTEFSKPTLHFAFHTEVFIQPRIYFSVSCKERLKFLLGYPAGPASFTKKFILTH